MALQRTRRPRLRSGRSLRSLGSPLNAYPLGARSRIFRVVACLAIAVAGCNPGGELADRVVTAARSEGAVIRMADLTSFPWDRVCLFGPYTIQGQVDSCLGFDWPEFKATGLEMDDSFSLMVFSLAGRVAHSEKVSRRLDFATSVYGRPFSPQTAVFRAVRTASGRTELVENSQAGA